MAESRAATREQHRGIHWQYWYSAWQMLQALAQPHGGVTHIEVEAAGADGVDDVILHFQDRVSACQLKRRQGGLFLGSDLFSPHAKKPALIAKLFTGWKQLVGQHAKVEVRLVTNARASDDPANRPIKPEEFIRRIIEPLRAGTPLAKEDETDLAEIRKRAGNPDDAEFRRFLSALHFDFEEADVEVIADKCAGLLRHIILCARGSGHMEAAAFQSWVSDISTRSEARALSVQEVDRALRATLDLPLHSAEHRITLPEHHVERHDVVQAILDKARGMLAEANGGYLRVLGPPGCGKTTLATWIADRHDSEVLVRYHVFAPDRASAAAVAHHATPLTFVRNLADVLRNRFPDDVAPRIPTPDLMHEAMQALAIELSRLAEKGARLIIIDGIDHVIRAGLDRDGLLHALPQPPPPGVVFLLFGQPDWKYPEWLTRCPRFDVPLFKLAETLQHLCAQLGWQSADPDVAAVAQQLQEKTGGNPLSIYYNIAAIRPLGPDPARVAAELPKLFGPEPHMGYARLLDDVRQALPMLRDSESLRDDLLACFAVATAPLTHARLEVAFADEHFTQRNARDFLARLRPVVVEVGEKGSGRYRLFHDDFRRYAEEQTDAALRKDAHRRLARALEQDWQDEELSAWVEHLWSGGEYRQLAELPETQKLEEWLIRAPARSVMDLHRHALAASFHLADENLIFRTSLAAERAWEAAGEGTGPTLRDWSFKVLPKGLEQDALQRRAEALRVAADGFDDDPQTASAVAGRFLLQPSALDPEEHWHRGYLMAHARWLLRGDQLEQAVQWTRDEGLAWIAIREWSAVLEVENRPHRLAHWATALVCSHPSLDRELAKAALLHLAEGRLEAAAAIARVLREATANPEAQRDGCMLLLTLGKAAELEPPEAGVVWLRNGSHEPIAWRDFFFDGIANTSDGAVATLGECLFPPEFADFVNPEGRTQDWADFALFIWRCGCAVGLARRRLLPPNDFAAILSQLLSPMFGSGWTGRLHARSPQVYLPPLALVTKDQPALCQIMRKELLRWLAQAGGSEATPKTYGLLDALWFIDPEQWRRQAHELMELALFPGTEPWHRIKWRSYWESRLAERGVESTPYFRALMRVVELGGNRKMDPALPAVDLLGRRPLERVEVQQVRRLVDLLLRMHTDPEGRKQARGHMPDVLCVALRLEPALFEGEFLRAAELGAVEPFGRHPASIAARWLAKEPTVALPDLLALWHWVAACPGSFREDAEGEEVGRELQARLRALKAEAVADQIGRWIADWVPPKEERARESSSSNDFQQEHLIEDVDLRWFSPWWYFHHATFNQLIATGGEADWRDVCQRLVPRVLRADRVQLELDGAVAGWLMIHRASTLDESMLEVALAHLSEKVRFQAPPPLRDEKPVSKSSPGDVFVRLLAQGLKSPDGETRRRAQEGLAATARHPATAPLGVGP